MTREETAKLLSILAAAYQNFIVDEAGIKLNVWHNMLEDLEYKIVQVAASKLILESPYPPTISDIRKQVVEITVNSSDGIDAATAWGEVIRAIRLYGYYRADEAISSMSPRTAKVVKMLGWEEICRCEEPGVIRGQFLKMYDTVTSREKHEALLPQALKNKIHTIVGNNNVELLEGNKAV